MYKKNRKCIDVENLEIFSAIYLMYASSMVLNFDGAYEQVNLKFK